MKKDRINWKDYLYFNKSEKVAIFSLLILVLLSGSIYIASGVWGNYDGFEQNNKALAEFDEFQKNLKPTYNSKKSGETKDANGNDSASKKERKPKADKSKLEEGQSIDLNTANIDALKRIPGIGDTFAQRIITYRDNLGGFVDVEQLKEIQGFSKKKYENTSTYFVIKKKHRRLRVNKLSAEQLCKHPYLSDMQAASILQKRGGGKLKTIEDLSSLPHFSAKDIERLSDYLLFD